MENFRSLEELETVVNESKVTLELEFIIRTMKVLELAVDSMDDTEQRDLVSDYANTLFHEVSEFMESEELTMLEDNNQIVL